MDCVTAGNILVQLFLQTKPKYMLNNKKLQYLLCIAQTLSLSNGRALFDDDIRNLKNDFSLEKIADNFVYNKPIQEGTTESVALSKSVEDFVIPFSVQKIYSFNECVSDEEKKLLIEVFIAFGGYSETSLCGMLNEFKPLRQFPIWTDIPKNSIKEFVSHAFNEARYENNKIISFCRECFKSDSVTEGDNISEATLIKPEVYAPSVKKDILLRYSPMSLKGLNTNKNYTVYIETEINKPVKDVVVLALSNNTRVLGTLKKLNDTIYCYSFTGVSSNLKICVDI